MKVLSFVVCLVFCSQIAHAISLKEMQEEALGNREVVKRYMLNLEKSESDIKRARSGYLPSVDVSYTLNSLDEDSTMEADKNSIIYGAVSYNIFNGFRDKYAIDSAQLQNEVEVLQLQGLKQDLQLNVSLRYLDVYERRANLKVAENNYNTLAKVHRDGENRANVGLIDKNELLKFKVDLDNSDILVKAARAGLDKSIHLLVREIGKPLQLSNLNFVEFEHIPQVKKLGDTEDKMLKSRSELLALERLVEVSSFRVKSEQGGFLPTVRVVGSYKKYDDEYINGTGDVNEDELRAQLVLSLNLFNGYQTQESVAIAAFENRGLQYDLDELKNSFRTELTNLHIDFDVSLRNIEVALRNIEHAEESLRITNLKYDEGLERESDLLDAITSLSRAQYNHVAVVRTVFLNHFRILRMIEGFEKTQ